MSLSAKEPAAGAAGLRCTQCRKPFGFVVAYCPFCGSSQQPQPPPAPQAPKPVPLQPPAPVPSDPAPRTTATAAAPQLVPPAAGPLPSKPAKPGLPTRFRGIAVLVMIAIGGVALLLRHGPMATVIVSVSPDVTGAVLIDGRRVGQAGERLRVAAGVHSLGFAADGWLAAPRAVSLQANQQRIIPLQLMPLPAVLVISHDPPDAVLRLDSRLIDAGRSELSVPPGRHRLTATRPGYRALTLDLLLERGERRAVSMALTPLVIKVVAMQAPVGSWSEPVALPPRTDFTLSLNGRIRLRVGQEVYLVDSNRSINLGDVRGAFLQIKAVDDQPVDVHLFLKPE